MGVYRGDIFYVKNFVRVSGSEQTAERPAVVVSNDIGNNHSEMCEVVYLTTKEKKPLPTHTQVMAKVPSTALCEQICSVSQDRLTEYIRTCTDEEMKEIERALMVSLGLDIPLITDVTAVQRANNQEIDDLKMKLEGAERQLDEALEDRERIMKEACKLKLEYDELKNTDKLHVTPVSCDVTALTTERDLYKSLYEQLIDKMIG